MVYRVSCLKWWNRNIKFNVFKELKLKTTLYMNWTFLFSNVQWYLRSMKRTIKNVCAWKVFKKFNKHFAQEAMQLIANKLIQQVRWKELNNLWEQTWRESMASINNSLNRVWNFAKTLKKKCLNPALQDEEKAEPFSISPTQQFIINVMYSCLILKTSSNTPPADRLGTRHSRKHHRTSYIPQMNCCK